VIRSKISKRLLGSLGLLVSSVSAFSHNSPFFPDSETSEEMHKLPGKFPVDFNIGSGTGEHSFLKVPKTVKHSAVDMSTSIMSDIEALPLASVKAEAMEPLVQMKDGKAQISSNFSPKTYAEMEGLSYELIKGCASSSTNLLEKFQTEGWTINGFSGLSGKTPQSKDIDGSNEDLAGFVAFQPKTGEAVVVFHGSQDPHDWENNLDGQMIHAREFKDGGGIPFLFNGRISRGNAERYLSSKRDIYRILDRLKAHRAFHITVTGHSLGGAMGELAVADLATYFAKTAWGRDYNNAESNRVRGYFMSGALVFDDEASEQVEKIVGRHNVIQDAVESDPVYYMSGKSTMAALEKSTRYGPTALGLWFLQRLGLTKVAHPQLVAFLYGKGRHIGHEALQSATEVQKLAAAFKDEDVQEALDKKGWWSRWWTFLVGEKLAPIHYGSSQIQQDGSGKLTKAFDPRFIIPETLAERIEKTELQAKTEPQAKASPPVAEQPKAWYQWLLPL
jgi:Lipase (class 3)